MGIIIQYTLTCGNYKAKNTFPVYFSRSRSGIKPQLTEYSIGKQPCGGNCVYVCVFKLIFIL